SVPHRRGVPLAFGTAGAVFVLVAVVLTAGLLAGGGDRRGAKQPVRQAVPARPESARPLAVPASPTPAPGGAAVLRKPRKVERAATITLSASQDDVESVADDVI